MLEIVIVLFMVVSYSFLLNAFFFFVCLFVSFCVLLDLSTFWLPFSPARLVVLGVQEVPVNDKKNVRYEPQALHTLQLKEHTS